MLREIWVSHVALVVKNPAANTGDVRDSGSNPGSGSSPGEGHGNPLWHSCLGESHRQRSLVGSWVAKNQTWLKWLNTHAPKETDVCDPWHNSQKASFWDTQIWVLILALSVPAGWLSTELTISFLCKKMKIYSMEIASLWWGLSVNNPSKAFCTVPGKYQDC